MINFLAYKNDTSFDFTKEKIHTLSDQSLNIVKQFKGKEISFNIYSKRADWERYLNLLNMYKRINNKIVVNAIDVDENPAKTRLNNITENGTLIINYNSKEYRTIIKDELSVTNLLYKILNPQAIKLLYSTGHNELDFNKIEGDGLSYLQSKIKNSSFELEMHDLTNIIPESTSALLIMNPQVSFLESEIENLRNYIHNGGNVIMTLSPQFNNILITELMSLLNEFGIEFINGLVLDRLATSEGGQPSVPIITNYPSHPINSGFKGRTVFPVSGFFIEKKDSPIKWKRLILTQPFPAVWGELSFDEVKSGRADYSAEKDYKGPLNIAMAGQTNKGRIVLFSSSMFVSNQFQGQSNNFNYFLNALNWVINAKSISSLNRPSLEGNLVYISDIHFNFIFYFAVLLFPFLFFGFSIYLFRKKLSR